MRTANRKPRVSNKPSKGMKTYLKQGLKALKKSIALASAPTDQQTNWNQPAWARQLWLSSFGSHQPHQGSQERARRARQMREHTHINPEAWI